MSITIEQIEIEVKKLDTKAFDTYLAKHGRFKCVEENTCDDCPLSTYVNEFHKTICAAMRDFISEGLKKYYQERMEMFADSSELI